MSYTLGELRALLSDLESLPDSVEVRLATQPNCPFEYSIAQAKLVSPVEGDIQDVKDFLSAPLDATSDKADRDEARSELSRLEEIPSILYLCEGSQLGYASRTLWDAE